MTPDAPIPTPPVSPKVTAASAGSLIASVLLAVVVAVVSPQGLSFLGSVPPFVTFLIVAIAPPVITFLSGYVKADGKSYLTTALASRRYQGKHEA